MTVEENLGLRLRTPEERERAYAAFPILGQRRRQVGGFLSGGEQQMLALASALVRPPDLLVADEPSLGLAPLVAEEIWKTLVRLRDEGVAILLVEEKSSEVLRFADDVALMALGRIVLGRAPRRRGRGAPGGRLPRRRPVLPRAGPVHPVT